MPFHHSIKTRLSTNKTWITAVFLVVLLWIALAIVFHDILVVPRGNRFDFYAPWAAIQALPEGLDPYSTQVSQRIQQQQQLFFEHPDGGGFVHPPHVIVLFFPFAQLPFPLFISLWVASLFVMCPLAIMLILQMLQIRPGAFEVAVLCLAVLTFRYSMIGITFGQPACLSLIALLLAAYLLTVHRDYLSGAILAVALVKPDLAIGPALFLIGLMLAKKRPQALWGLITTALLLTAATTVLLGKYWPANFFRAISAYMEYHVSSWGLGDIPLHWLPVAAVTLALAAWRIIVNLRASRWEWAFSLAVSCSLILVPQSGAYNLTILLIPIVVGWARSHRVTRWAWLLLWWLVPWLLWKTAPDPLLDLRLLPWLITVCVMTLETLQYRGRGITAEVKTQERAEDIS